ncbi:hypothetical protein PO124_09195 [Bacillus licheniformis]|nr:hypothetical protein [Bacillus licheniformis]
MKVLQLVTGFLHDYNETGKGKAFTSTGSSESERPLCWPPLQMSLPQRIIRPFSSMSLNLSGS